DDAVHGAAAGACAYKTLAFALGKGDKEISLAASTYSAPDGGVQLLGAQELLCNNATIVPAGGVNVPNIAFAGTSNAVRDCTVKGGGNCIEVRTKATGATRHLISKCDVSTCDTGVFVGTLGG